MPKYKNRRFRKPSAFTYRVVSDPTAEPYYPGDFMGNCFRYADVNGCAESFPEGLVFLNQLSGKLYQVNNGQLIKVTAQVCGTGAVERINNHA